MSKGQTRSPYNRSQRKAISRRLFLRGYSDADVARKLRVDYSTARRYREEWERDTQRAARDNPHILKDILANTIKALEELDEIRRECWEQYNDKKTSAPMKQGYLNTMLRAQEQRVKILGVFGVKQEFLLHLQQVQLFQAQLLGFLQRELCGADRDKLVAFLEGVNQQASNIVEGELVDDGIQELPSAVQ